MPAFRPASSAVAGRRFSIPFQPGTARTLLAVIVVISVPILNGQDVLAEPSERPNIVLIMADDMGYGDVHALNDASQIPTPNLDRLAAEGMTFTDAHTPSAVCTPTRYGLLTGRYCWRTRLKRGVLGGYSRPLIQPDRKTIAGMLNEQGYQTTVVGKWHLGMKMPLMPKAKGKRSQWKGDPGVDFSRPIAEGPTTRGFDHCFCVSASLDMPPYVYIEDGRFTTQPTIQQKRQGFPAFVRAGPRAEDFQFATVLDRLTDEAVETVQRGQETDGPFFLYFALTAPHKPTLPHKRFRGKTDLGPYGDFITQVDASIGRVLTALEQNGLTEETLVICTSDNGSYMDRYDEAGAKDHLDDPHIQGYRAEHHRANGPFRGTKADIWEGGHHVAFFARWPGLIEPASQWGEPICLTDVYATCAAITGAELDDRTAEDSVSLLPILRGEEGHRGVPVIHHSAGGMFAIRDGKWKLVLGNGSGGRERPRGKPFDKPYRLFNLAEDIGETNNLAEERPEIVQRLTKAFQRIRNGK